MKSITDIEYIRSNFKELADEENEINGGVGAVHNNMDANEFNTICKTIEARLNSLYAKTRMLEEISDFAVTYVQEQIKNRENMFRERLKIIEDTTDSYRDTSSISIMVPFEQEQGDVYDRNGEKLLAMVLKNSCLESSGSVLSQAQLLSISTKSTEACSNNSYNNLLQNKEGTSFYCTDRAIKGGLKEEVTVLLKKPAVINKIDIEPINAKASNAVAVKDTTGATTEFKFTLTCSEPQIISMPIESDAYAGDGSLYQGAKVYKRKEEDRLIQNMQKSIDISEKKNMMDSMLDKYKYWHEHSVKVADKNTMLVEEFG